MGAILLTWLGAGPSATAQTNYFTEYFNSGTSGDPGVFDLGGKTIMFEPVGGTNYYDVIAVATNITELPYSTAGYSGFTWNFPEIKTLTIPGGRNVYLYGNPYNTFYLCSSGYIRFDYTYSWYIGPSEYGHFLHQQISPFFAYLNPSLSEGGGGKVTVFEAYSLENPIATVVTFENVPSAYSNGRLYTFQCVMYYSGHIEMSWLNTSISDSVVVGLSRGDGYPSDYQETNLSAYFDDEPVNTYDIDEDGLPDAWEAYYFGSYTNCNPDGHGDTDDFDNESEYIAGTDPTDASDYFRVYCSFNGSQSNPGIVLNWTPVVSNRMYTVNNTAVLTSPLSPMVTDILYPTNSYTVPMDQAGGFFNVGVRML